ncbi:MAG: hypothetical protein M3N29_01755 [Chloroflexota bacterium]|nr:hypothetical protein [Chloroflexota bacterium]
MLVFAALATRAAVSLGDRGRSRTLADGLLTVSVACGGFLLVTVLFADSIGDNV